MRISTRPAGKCTASNLIGTDAIHLRRNFTLGVTNGVAYNLYLAVLSTELVLTWFLSELTSSNLLISLLIPIELGSWYFLQLLLSGWVQRQPRVLPLYRRMGVIRVAALALLPPATHFLGPSNTLLIVFLCVFMISSVASGIAALPFLNVVAKTIPPTRRGMYFAYRRFGGALLGLFGGVLVKIVLSPKFPLTFPDNYALLFSLGLVIITILVGSFSLVAEPAEAADPRRVSLGSQLRRAYQLQTRDRNYHRYLRLRVAVAASSFALPFYAVFARRALNAPQGMVGTYLIGSTLTSVLSNLISGRLGDRRGNLLLIRIAALTSALPSAIALLVAHLPAAGAEKSHVFALVFVSLGLHATVNTIGSINYMLELASPANRALYIGFANGVIGLAMFASPLGGAIVDRLGFEALFLFSFVCGLCAVVFSLGLEEPRKATDTLG